jgi:hypothetical protein
MLDCVKVKILCQTLPKYVSSFPACIKLNELETLTKALFNEISAMVMPSLSLTYTEINP